MMKSCSFGICLTTAKTLVFAVAFTCSCSQSVSDNAKMIDVSNPVEVQLLDLADDFRIVQLEETDYCVGEITDAKVYGDDIFLLDRSLRGIVHYNKDGRLLNVLDRKGRAKSEYINIDCFAYSPEKGLLYVHTRSTTAIKVYSVADMSFRYEMPLGLYLNAFETLPDNTLMAIQDPVNDMGGALVTIDAESGEVTEIMTGLKWEQWSSMAGGSMCLMKDGSLSLCIPGYPNRLMKCTAAGVEEMAQFVMEGSPLGRKFWTSRDEGQSNFLYAIRQRSEKPDACIFPGFAVKGDSGVSSFWAVTGNSISTLGLAMNLFAKGKMYRPVLPDGSLTKAFGLSAEGEYLILVRTEQIKDYLNEDVKSEHSLLFCRF